MRSSWKIRTWRLSAWALAGMASARRITAGTRRLTTGVIPISNRPLYNSFAWAYDLVVPSPAAPQPDEAARLLAGRRTVVDVGCGTGRHSAGPCIRRLHRYGHRCIRGDDRDRSGSKSGGDVRGCRSVLVASAVSRGRV